MTIGFCYNVRPDKPSKVGIDLDYDEPDTISGISKAIKANGYEVIEVNADINAFEKLKKLKRKIDLVFNISEGVSGDARESQVPLFCEILGIPYTHSSPTVHAIGLDKNMTKLAVAGLGVRVPRSLLLTGENLTAAELTQVNFPLIIKPNTEGSSAGVFSANVVDDEFALEKRVKELRRMKMSETMLVEEYIDGREFTVAVWGNEEVEVLPIIEQKFGFLPKGQRKIAGYELKWLYEDKLKDLTRAYGCPAKLKPAQQREIEVISTLVYQGLGVRDVARVDYRMNKLGELYFLEINTLPGMIPREDVISYFPLAARKAGYSYEQMVGKLIDLAKKRYNL